MFIDVRDYGATGDGVADDTLAIQQAIDAAGAVGGTVLFPPGIYQVTSVGLKAGVRYLGYGATIRRPANQGKWVRTFDAWKPGYQHSSDNDSAPIHIEGLDFDGNRAEQGPYDRHELEQAHLIFLAADSAKAGRLRVRISNCTFRDGVADAISIHRNVETQVTNCTAIDCFRGGVVLTGGYSRVQLSNLIARGKVHATGIDIEVDGPGFGGSKDVELLMDNISLPDGDFDVGVAGNSVVIGNRIVAKAPFNVYGGGTARLSFSDCEFGVGEMSPTGNRITLPGDLTFRNCRFTVEASPINPPRPRQFAAAHIYWNISGSNATKQAVRFQDCVFRSVSGGLTDVSHAIYTRADALGNANRLELTGGEIGGEFASGVVLSKGGRATMRNTRIAARRAAELVSSPGYHLDVLIDGIGVADAAAFRASMPPPSVLNRIVVRNLDELK